MNNQIMQYNPQDAVKASGSDFITEGGDYAFKIIKVKHIMAGTGSKGLEFSCVTSEASGGQKANFLKLYYQKASGERISGGYNCIQAIMGFTGIQSISEVQDGQDTIAPEFKGKIVGMFLQKKLYTKSSGGEGYAFDIKLPFCPKTMATMRERETNSEVKTVKRMVENYIDIDERVNQQAPQQGFTPPPAPQNQNQPTPAQTANMDSLQDSDIPF